MRYFIGVIIIRWLFQGMVRLPSHFEKIGYLIFIILIRSRVKFWIIKIVRIQENLCWNKGIILYQIWFAIASWRSKTLTMCDSQHFDLLTSIEGTHPWAKTVSVKFYLKILHMCLKIIKRRKRLFNILKIGVKNRSQSLHQSLLNKIWQNHQSRAFLFDRIKYKNLKYGRCKFREMKITKWNR